MACFADNSESCEFVTLGEFLDRSGKVGRVEVVQCTKCGHGVSMPPLPDVSFLYENRESQDYQPDAKGLSHTIKDIAFRSQARKLLRHIGSTKGRVLDFGCGSGQFTKVFGRVLEGSAEVVGADMHPEPPMELADGRYLDPSELGSHKGSFDTVLAMHVVEHDDDPARLLAAIAAYARDGGKVVIEVPNIDCVWTGLFGKFWDAWYLPYHRQHFTSTSLVKLMQRAGLKIESVHNITVPTMGRSFANIFGRTNNLFWLLLGAAAFPVQLLGERLTRRPTAIRVIATKGPN
ncbi:MAG TPA: class I SAM-dependent methyltransferase [Sphingomicrobium sp.]|nr:class I SAM-dependent methyltransferase [Sphingomicrobium sp.]